MTSNAASDAGERPDFQEFFTVIDNDTETHHPRVHYVFADDEELTAMTIEPDPDHRIVIIDIDKDGKSIWKASSLSPEWQNIKAEVSQAPSWGETQSKGLMLKITGCEPSYNKLPRQVTICDLLAEFDKNLDNLDSVLQQAEIPTEEPKQAS